MSLRIALAGLLLLDALPAQLLERAQKGDAEAQFTLGKNYEAGRGKLKQDYTQAAHWYGAAADQNDPFAQASLGLLYRFGKGVAQDDGQAYMWFTLSIAQLTGADKDSILELRTPLASRMTAAQVAEAELAARRWKPKAAR